MATPTTALFATDKPTPLATITTSTSSNVLSEYHRCIGAYEDKPTNCIYYFVIYNGPKRSYDSILEYNLFTDNIRTVYQDGRMSSSGLFESILNFDVDNPITGVNKIENILYWTDNKNRPRKINVELAKQNEFNITDGLQFYDFYYRSDYSTVYITPTDINIRGFNIDDNIYAHVSSPDLSPYNGYAKVTGIIRKIPQGVTFNVTENNFIVTSSSAISSVDLEPDDFIGIVNNNFAYYFQVDSISGTTITLKGDAPSFTDASANPLHLIGVDVNTNMAGYITNCPWAFSAAMVDQNGNSLSGILLHANPENAYSPLISFGGTHDRSKYMDVIKYQPTLRPQPELEKDLTTSKNDILDNLFQFKYRYRYYDNELSSYSGISDVKLDPQFSLNTPLTHEDYRDSFNIIDVEYFDTMSDVKKTEIVARKGNTGEFFLIDTVENNFITYLKILKNELITDSDYYLTIDKSRIKFKNNGIYPFVDRVDSEKLFDVVPKLAQAQTILSNNRIAYGNVVEGYDNTPIVVDSRFNEEGPKVQSISNSLKFYTSSALSTQVTNESGGNGTVMAEAIEDGTGGSGWKSNNGENCDWNVYLDFSNISLNDENSQTISINIRWGLNRRSAAFSLEGSKQKTRAGRLNMKVDVTGLVTKSQVINKIIQQFNAGDYDGGTITTLAHNSGGANPDNAVKEEGFIKLNSVQSNTVLKIHFECKDNKNEPNGGGATDPPGWANDNDGWVSVVHTHIAKFTSGSPGFNSFKTGAFHDFGLVYFDETNRCSFVNVAPKYDKFSGSRAYNRFVTEDGVDLGQTSSAILEVFNKPPKWATHYQVVYTGNTTVGDFMQITSPISKAGTGGDTQIYIGLQSLKANKSSYNEASGSDLDFEFQEKGGDRIRFISCESNGVRKKFGEYLDFKITGFDFYQGDLEDGPIDATTNPGFYIRIANPGSTTVKLEDNTSVSIGHSGFSFSSSGYNKLIAEVYREKKTTSEESMLYYEVGDKLEINNPGSIIASHVGNLQDQSTNYSLSDETGVPVSDVPATISILSGDVYLKPREMFTSISSEDLQNLENFPCEDYFLNDFHNTNHWSRGRINVVNNNSEERRLSATVYHSETYSSTGSINGLSSFNPANSPYFDYNVDFGSIQSLKMRDNDLIIFHENKVGRVLVEKDILTTASADQLVSLSKNIIANYVNTFAGEYGCGLHPESIAQNGQKFYFVDIRKGSVLRLGGDGLTVISDYNMRDYFRDLGEMYVKYNPDSPVSQQTYMTTSSSYMLVGGYDPKYDEYVVTFPEIKSMRQDNVGQYSAASTWAQDIINWEDETQVYNIQNDEESIVFNPVTVAFQEGLNRWTSFYSFIPEFYSKIDRQFITFKKGRLYRHNDSDIYNRNTLNKAQMNTFYGNRNLSYLDFVFNAEPSSVKTYNAIGIESDTKFLTGLFSNMGQYYGNYDDVISTSIAFRKIDGVVTRDESNKIIGEGTEFYKDVKPGDLVRVFGYTEDKEKLNPIYKDFIVSKIHSNIFLELNESLDYGGVKFKPNKSLMYVIDYKSKEGIQYADIPFCSSGVSNDSDQISFGDGSEIISIGRIKQVGNKEISLEDNINESFLSESYSTNLSSALVGAEYIVTNVEDGVSLEGFTNTNSLAERGVVFTLTSTPPSNVNMSLVSTDLALYSKDDSGQTYFLGYYQYTNQENNNLSYVSVLNSNVSSDLEVAKGSFIFGVKRGKVEGEKMKGSYMRAILATNKNQSTQKFNIYAANADVDKSELSGNK